MTKTETHNLLIIDHSDNTGGDEFFTSHAQALASLEEFAASEDLMTAETTDGGYALLTATGRQNYTAYITN